MSRTPFAGPRWYRTGEDRALLHGALVCALGAQHDNAFLNLVAVRHLHRGQAIFAGTDDHDVLVVVISGLVKLISFLPDGRQQIVALLSGSDCCWQRASAPDRLRVEAASEVDAFLLHGKPFADELGKHPEARRALLDRSLSDLDHARGHLLVLGCMTAREKVASFLLELCKKSDSFCLGSKPRTSNLPTLLLSMPREDIADYLGLRLETVSRNLSLLKRQGIIRLIDSRTLEICDPDQLTAIVQQNVAPVARVARIKEFSVASVQGPVRRTQANQLTAQRGASV